MEKISHRRVFWPVERWPETDQQAWYAARQKGNPMVAAGRAADWRPPSCRAAIGAYGRFLAFIAETGAVDPSAAALAAVTADNLRAYVRWLRATCAPITVGSYIAILCMLAEAMAPDRNWSWLQTLRNNLKLMADPIRDKRRRIVAVGELAQLGYDLMTEAEMQTCSSGVTHRTAQDYRDGLSIALLASRPLRQKNFLSIEIGLHLAPQGGGYLLRFSSHETKTHRPLEQPFPKELLPMLSRYLDCYRPFLLSQRHGRGKSRQCSLPSAGNRLWVTQYGTPFGANAQAKALKKHTTARFGRYVNAHLFRDCAATSLVNHDPNHIGVATKLLGHTKRITTEKHYVHAQANVALCTLQQQMFAMRKEVSQRKQCPL